MKNTLNCREAETALMQHIEKTIVPAQARELALHTMACASCRQLFVMMDAEAEFEAEAEGGVFAHSDEISPVFTQGVMAQVSTLDAYLPARSLSLGEVFMRLLWAFGIVAVGVGMLLAINPQWAASIFVADAVARAGDFAAQFIERAGQIQGFSTLLESTMFGIGALVFAGLVAGGLYGLHRGNESNSTSLQV
jgi:hypothetical protein